MSWTIQICSLNSVLVGWQNSFKPIALRFKDVSVESKTMTCSVGWWNLASESINWDFFIAVIILKDPTYRGEGLVVLVSIQVLAMQRVSILWVTVRQSEINGDMQTNVATTEDVVKEWAWSFDCEIRDFNLSFLAFHCAASLFQIIESSVSCCQEFVVSRGHWSEEVKLDFLASISIAKVHQVQLELCPILSSSLLVSYFWLVHWLVLTWRQELPDDEENGVAFADVSLELDDGIFTAVLQLFPGYLYLTVRFSWWVLERIRKNLVLGSDHGVHLELNTPDVLLCLEVVSLLVVIHIVGLNQKVLSLLEEIFYVEIWNEVGVQVVINTFCPSEHLLERPVAIFLKFVQYYKSICFWERIKVWQFLKRERQLNCLL